MNKKKSLSAHSATEPPKDASTPSAGPSQSRRQRVDPDSSHEELQRTLAELQVYQTELEMQNQELRNTHEELQATRLRYLDLFELAPVGYLTLTDSAVIAEANLTAADLLGCPRASLIGKPFSGFIDPDCRGLLHELFARPHLGQESHTQELHLLKGGRERIWGRLIIRSIEDKSGASEFRVVLSDISEVYASAKALRETRTDLERAQVMAKIGVWRISGRGAVILCSDETYRILGIPRGIRVDQNLLLSLVHEDDRERVARHRSRAVRGRAYDIEYRLVVDGQLVWAREKAEPRLDDNREIPDVFGTIQDISELKHAEDALRREDRLKDEFLATLAHELRNPLAPLRNGIKVLQLTRGNPESDQRVLTLMESELRHMVRLLDDLLDLSRISQGRIELHNESVDLLRVVKQAVEANRSLVEDAGHQLTVDLPERPVPVIGDPVRLAQVLANLLNNAVKYTSRGGLIVLRVAAEAGEAVVRIRDSGIGIPPDMLDKVFDLFTQVDRTYHRGTGGLGIGLNLAKRLVELHGGQIEALSRGNGTGAEFVVRLPLALEQTEVAEAQAAAKLDSGSSARHRVLIVDDNPSIVDSLKLLLELLGQEVQGASSGKEALELGESFEPELILLDIGMPGLSGYDTCRRMRELPWGQRATIMAMTGWAQDKDKLNSQLAGFDRHLVKPVDPEELETLLESLP